MAQIEGRGTLSASVVMVLSEEEAGALDALAGYGIDPFLAVFYEKMGKSYLQKYEAGLRSLFKSIHGGDASVELILQRAKSAREVFSGQKKAVDHD